MANLSEDIQCAGFDTRPPMLDRIDFASWQQRIRLYCQGKENRVKFYFLPHFLSSFSTNPITSTSHNHLISAATIIPSANGHHPSSRQPPSSPDHHHLNRRRLYHLSRHKREKRIGILKSIDEGPFQMGTFRETLAEGLPIEIGQGNNAKGTGTAGNEGAQNRVGNVYSSQARQIKCYNCNGIGHKARNCTQPKRTHISKYFKDKMLLMQAQENGVVLDEEQLMFIAGGQDNVVDKDVDEPPNLKKPVKRELQQYVSQKGKGDLNKQRNVILSRFTEMHDAHIVVQARCLELKAELSKLNARIQNDDHNELVKRFSNLEITRAKCIDQTTALLTKNENLKVQINEKIKCVTMDSVKPKVLAPAMYAIDVESILPRCRNNREVYLDYLKHLKESVAAFREIVEEAGVERPLYRSLAFACLYTKHFQELLEYVVGTCPKDFNKQDKKQATTLFNRKKHVTFEDQCDTSNNNTQKHVEQLNIQKTNVPVLPSTRVNSCTDSSRSKPRSNTRTNRISPAKSVNKKKVEEHPKTNKSSRKKSNRVDSSISSKRAMVWKPKQIKQVRKAIGKLLTNVGYQWKPTGRIFTLGKQCPLTRFTKSKVVPVQQTENVSTSKSVITEILSHTSQRPLTRYQRRKKQYKAVPDGIPTTTANHAINASMQFVVAYDNQQDPNKIRDPTFQTLHLRLFSNACRTDRPWGKEDN
nr:integrase, catalytic region, zinc finger, CCHC-type, peptidase aspartic, catalytic [Tanacetum cinerariifolium]